MNPPDGEEAFHTWCKSLQGRSTTVVIAGQYGVGKSTLVKNLLRLSDADAMHLAQWVTRNVTCYNSHVKGANITIIDTPGLAGASEGDEFNILAQLSKKTKGEPDILLYCVSMAHVYKADSKRGESDRKIIKLLTTAFTPRIWERTILVLTFADTVKERHQKNKDKVEKEIENHAKIFETILQMTLTDRNVTVIPVLQDEGEKTRPAKQIAAVPAGQTRDEEIQPHKKWNVSIYEEVLRKCQIDAVPALLTVVNIFTGQIYKIAASAAIAGAVLGAIGLGIVTGGLGALVGAVVGGAALGAVGVAISKRYYGIAYSRFRNQLM